MCARKLPSIQGSSVVTQSLLLLVAAGCGLSGRGRLLRLLRLRLFLSHSCSQFLDDDTPVASIVVAVRHFDVDASRILRGEQRLQLAASVHVAVTLELNQIRGDADMAR